MSLRSKLEGAALVVAALAVVAFVVSAAVGLRFSAGDAVSADVPAVSGAPVPGAAAGAPRVEVLNGAGKVGLARDATERLRTAGFDVVYFGNAPEPRGMSVVLDRGGRSEAAHRAAVALGITDVRQQPDATRFLDVTVVLGKDWPPPAKVVKESWIKRTWKAIKDAL
ncbi:MAG TPA: LytR C-terminal domain-containing protein [Longimicrobiales bacterium]